MGTEQSEVLQGTLDPMILRTLHAGNWERISGVIARVLKLQGEL
jgi:hypothetical protein